MNIVDILKSRTVWTAFLIIAFNAFPQFESFIPDPYFSAVNIALGTAVAYFRLNPKQYYPLK